MPVILASWLILLVCVSVKVQGLNHATKEKQARIHKKPLKSREIRRQKHEAHERREERKNTHQNIVHPILAVPNLPKFNKFILIKQ